MEKLQALNDLELRVLSFATEVEHDDYVPDYNVVMSTLFV